MTEAEYRELVESYQALQQDYEHIGWVKTDIYARSCRALDMAETTMPATIRQLHAGANIEDVWKNQQSLNR